MSRKALISAVAMLAVVSATTAPARAGDGGAIAAGIIGGLALGGIAAAASQPAYGYPVYVDRPYYRHFAHCWREPRQAYDYYGNAYWRSVRICR